MMMWVAIANHEARRHSLVSEGGRPTNFGIGMRWRQFSSTPTNPNFLRWWTEHQNKALCPSKLPPYTNRFTIRSTQCRWITVENQSDSKQNFSLVHQQRDTRILLWHHFFSQTPIQLTPTHHHDNWSFRHFSGRTNCRHGNDGATWSSWEPCSLSTNCRWRTSRALSKELQARLYRKEKEAKQATSHLDVYAWPRNSYWCVHYCLRVFWL